MSDISDLRCRTEQVLVALDAQLQLEPALWARLAPLLQLRRLRRGQLLLAQGAPARACYALCSGEVEVAFTAVDGQMSVLEHVQAPLWFGLAAFVCGQCSSYEARATRASQVLVIGQAAYALMMQDLPGFAPALLHAFARRYAGTLRLLAASRHAPASERLGLAMQQLCQERGGAPDPEGWQWVAATQVELAQLAHVSRQSTNRWLQACTQTGRLRLGYGGLWLRQG